MPALNWRTAIKGAAGAGAGLFLWLVLSPIYAGFLAWSAEPLLRAFERPAVTRLNTDNTYIRIDRSDFGVRINHPEIPSDDLTFNVILLCALFAGATRPLRDRNIFSFLLASLLLAITHVLATIVTVMSTCATKMGTWSLEHYGKVARNVWGLSYHFYRLVLMYAIAFAIWWIVRPAENEEVEPARLRKKARGRK
ncbi:MAG TPA: hypothetical protein VHL58_08730 [Thermoanaerobaculia bacterium]|nr:hypothetical protein [Thermoanaerobaculia bacterium]